MTNGANIGGYLPPRTVIHWLVDTVSKNGAFILNLLGLPDGTIDSKEIAVLDEIAAWLKISGEAILETRPWKVYGEGPNKVESGSFKGASIGVSGKQRHPLHAEQGKHRDLRNRPGMAAGGGADHFARFGKQNESGEGSAGDGARLRCEDPAADYFERRG